MSMIMEVNSLILISKTKQIYQYRLKVIIQTKIHYNNITISNLVMK